MKAGDRDVPWILIVTVAAAAMLFGRIAHRYRVAKAARGENLASFDAHVIAAFLLVAAAGLAFQTFYTYRHGWVYGEGWRKFCREDQPKGFVVRLWIHIAFVLLLTFFGLRYLLA